MPTTRPRYTVTETDALRASLDEVARRHPELADDRNAIFRLLVDEAVRSVDAERVARVAGRRAALASLAEGKYGSWPADWREQRDAEWPE